MKTLEDIFFEQTVPEQKQAELTELFVAELPAHLSDGSYLDALKNGELKLIIVSNRYVFWYFVNRTILTICGAMTVPGSGGVLDEIFPAAEALAQMMECDRISFQTAHRGLAHRAKKAGYNFTTGEFLKKL